MKDGGGLIATFTVTPALSAMLLRGRVDEHETWLVRQIRRDIAQAERHFGVRR